MGSSHCQWPCLLASAVFLLIWLPPPRGFCPSCLDCCTSRGHTWHRPHCSLGFGMCRLGSSRAEAAPVSSGRSGHPTNQSCVSQSKQASRPPIVLLRLCASVRSIMSFTCLLASATAACLALRPEGESAACCPGLLSSMLCAAARSWLICCSGMYSGRSSCAGSRQSLICSCS